MNGYVILTYFACTFKAERTSAIANRIIAFVHENRMNKNCTHLWLVCNESEEVGKQVFTLNYS